MIRAEQLSYRYPSGTTLRFPDVHVPQGEVLLLQGPSGCGKSTWLALAGALLRPSRGELTVAGRKLSALGQAAADAWRARSIGFLPQKLHLSEALSVYENLAVAQWAAGQSEDGARIALVLHELGIPELGQRLPRQISGGQAQRVALARAVLLRPQVLLADEPTASLDDEAAAAALALLCSTARLHGASLVIATHDARVEAYLKTLMPLDSEDQFAFQRLLLKRSAL